MKGLKTAGLYVPIALTLLTIGASLPSQESFIYWPLAILYMILVTLAVSLRILLTRGEIGIGHAVGMLAFLSIPPQAFNLMIWTMFLSSIIGGGIQTYRQNYLKNKIPSAWEYLEILSTTSARITLSFAIAGYIYFAIDGQIPLAATSSSAIPPLLIYSILYITLYMGLYFIEGWIIGVDVVGMAVENWLGLLTLLVVPVAFAVLGAVVYNRLPLELFGFIVIGFILGIIGPFSFSRTQSMLRQQLNEMRALSELGTALQSSTNLTTLLTVIKQRLPAIVNSEHILLALFDKETDKLSFPIVNDDQEADNADEILIKQVISSKKSLLISNNVARYMQLQRITPHHTPITSWLGVPLLTGGNIIGVLVMYSTNSRYFTVGDERLMGIIASTLATSIENAQLYHQQEIRLTRLNTLNTISILLSRTLSIDDILDTITTSVSMLSEANAVAIFMPDEESKTPKLIRHAGLSDQFTNNPPLLFSLPDGNRLYNANTTTLMEHPPTIITNVNRDQRTLAFRDIFAAEKVQALIELPLTNDVDEVGLIAVYYHSHQTFSAEFIEILRTFSNEASQSIKNALIYTKTDKALEKRLEQLFILAAIAHQTNASINIDEISKVVLQYAINYTQASRGFVALYDQKQTNLRVMHETGYPPGTFDNLAVLKVGNVGKALKSRKLEHITYIDSEARTVKMMPSTMSQISVPILRDMEVRGVLNLEDDSADTFSEEDFDFLTQVVNQAAIGIDNRNLFETVAQARDRMQVILDAITEGIVLLNKDGEIVLANPAVKIIGLDHNELINRSINELFEDVDQPTDIVLNMGFDSKADFQRFVHSLKSEWEDKKPKNYTVQGIHGSIDIERQMISIKNDEDAIIGVMLVFYDETEKRELDRTRDDLTRMIVHDLRSPLTAVVTSLRILNQIIPKDLEISSIADRTTTASQQAIRKLLHRVDALLDIAKMESGEINLETEVIGLEFTVKNVFEELEPLATERNISLKSDIANSLPPVIVDPDKMERIIQNLVDNALKYTPNGSEVMVRVKKQDDQFMRIDVIDDGPGIPDEYKERLFERFVQIRGQRGARRGVGLGLTFCRLMIEAHGGKVWVEDNPNGGSVFAFTIPIKEVPQHDEQNSNSAHAPGTSQKD